MKRFPRSHSHRQTIIINPKLYTMASAFFVTPEKKPQSATAPPSPTKTLPAGFRFPSGFHDREFNASDEESSLVVLTTQGSPALYREFISLNPDWCFRFSLIGEIIYFDDLVDGNESKIHESVVNHIGESINEYGRSLGNMIGRGNIFYTSTGEKFGDVGVPDVASMMRSPGGFNEDPNIIVEVAFCVSLRVTHAKIVEYFRRVDSITAALIVYIPDRRWRILESGMFDCTDGTMVIFYYERPPPAVGPMIVAARSAISFGDRLTPADYQRAREITGVSQAAFRGHGAREEDPPCTGMGQYTLRIPALRLLAHDVEDAMGDAVVAGLRAITHDHNLDALPLNIDLFALKRNIIVRGAHRMNRDRATADNPRPPLPDMYA